MVVLPHQLKRSLSRPREPVIVGQDPLIHGSVRQIQDEEGERRVQQLALQDHLVVAEDKDRQEDQVLGEDPREQRTVRDLWEKLIANGEQMNPAKVDHPFTSLQK